MLPKDPPAEMNIWSVDPNQVSFGVSMTRVRFQDLTDGAEGIPR
jgi:hypothetical protein